MAETILELYNDLQIQDNFIDAFDDNELSFHHKVPSIIDDIDWKDLTKMIRTMDTQPGLNFHARRQAKHDKKMTLSIRDKLIKENLIARVPYHGDQLYICSKEEFQQKASTFIDESGIYKFIDEVHPANPVVSQKCLNNVIKLVETTLKHLHGIESITDWQYILMHPPRPSIVRLNYLYFVPDLHKEEKPLQPIIICKNGPTWNIIHYLSGILWSMFNQVTNCKRFSNGDDLVYALEQQIKNGYHLHENTQFITFNINEICRKFSHERIIEVLEKFLYFHQSELHSTMTEKSLTIEIIIQLTRLVLQNQFFIYENKLYQQIHGSASGSLLTIPLACIYFFFGQSSSLGLVHCLVNNTNELFGRCRDDIFFTWNGSKDEVQTLINQSLINKQQHPSIEAIMATTGTTIHLLHLELGHDKGHLFTKIYHDPESDEYELPKTYDYHTYQPSSLLKAALNHAVHCCSNEKDFDDERRHLQLSYLMRGFPSTFIHKCIDEFYNELGIDTKNYFLFPIIPYQTLRQRVLNNYEQKIALKQQQQSGKQNMIRIPYPSHWDVQMAVNIKNDLIHILKDNSNNKEAALNNIQFEFVPRPQTPLTRNDYFVDKRPPLRLLTLAHNEKC